MKRINAACITQTLLFMLKEEMQEDGSVMIEIIKQYNGSAVGNYLD